MARERWCGHPIIFVAMTPALYSIAIFVHDIDRAVAFYRDTLGLPLVRQGSFGAEFLEGEPHLGVHPAAHPDARAMVGRHTGLTFHVPDLLHFCGILHIRGVGDQHHVKPRLVSISQSSEYGTVYTPDEIRLLADLAHDRGLLLHMDGARLANAAAALDRPLRAITADAGVDVLTFGGTKNGLLGGEAVVFLDPSHAEAFRFIRKQGMQLASKMRFVAAQFDALLGTDLWLRNARHANAMARRLALGLGAVPGVTVTQSVDANAVFAILPRAAIAPLQAVAYFHVWDEPRNEVRLMASFDTTPDDVDRFVEAAARIGGAHG
jgi:catechol 2,3-dioxygenase-like lactoylglutathione lyase family enzyme